MSLQFVAVYLFVPDVQLLPKLILLDKQNKLRCLHRVQYLSYLVDLAFQLLTLQFDLLLYVVKIVYQG